VGKIEQLVQMVQEYPDTPHRRKILLGLGDVSEMLNIILTGVAHTQGYTFENVHGRARQQKVISKARKDGHRSGMGRDASKAP